MKKIAILVSNPCVYDNRVIKQAESLTSAGYEVTVYCYGIDQEKAKETINNVQYIRVPRLDISLSALLIIAKFAIKRRTFSIGLPWSSAALLPFLFVTLLPVYLLTKFLHTKNSKFHKRSKALLSNMLMPAVHTMLFTRYYDVLDKGTYDIIHANDLDTALTAYFFSKKKNVPFIYDAHELESDRAIRKGFFVRIFTHIHEKKVSQSAAAVITVSQKIAERIQQLYDLKETPICILNAPWAKKDSIIKVDPIKKQLNLKEGDFLSLYVGVVNVSRNLEVTIESAQYLPPNHHIAFIGPPAEAFIQQIEQLLDHHNVRDRVHICPPVKQAKLIKHIESADLGLILSANICDSFNYAMPNKLFEMSFAGLPLLVSNLESIRRYVEGNQIGIVIEEKLTAKNIANAILEAESSYSQIKPTSEKVKDLKSRFGWEIQSEKLISLYKEIALTLCR